jgi:chromosome segregation ATPase
MSANALLVNVQTPAPDDSVKSSATVMLDQAKSLVIATPADYALAADALANIKGRWKTVDEERVQLKAPSLEGCRRVDAFFAAPLTALKEAEAVVKRKIDDYDKEQRRLAAARQAELDAIARREREKREAEAREAQRKADEKATAERKAADDKRRAEEAEREKARQAELARLKAERDAAEAQARGDREAREKAEREAREAREAAAAAEKAARDAAAAAQKLETRAEQTEQRGAERAELLQTQAASIVAPTVQIETPKVKGLSSRQEYKHRGVDLMALVKAVAEGKQPLAYLDFNHATLAGMAKALKQQMNVPGVEVYAETVTASRATR